MESSTAQSCGSPAAPASSWSTRRWLPICRSKKPAGKLQFCPSSATLMLSEPQLGLDMRAADTTARWSTNSTPTRDVSFSRFRRYSVVCHYSGRTQNATACRVLPTRVPDRAVPARNATSRWPRQGGHALCLGSTLQLVRQFTPPSRIRMGSNRGDNHFDKLSTRAHLSVAQLVCSSCTLHPACADGFTNSIGSA